MLLQQQLLQQQMERLVRATSCFSEAVALCDVTSPGSWRLLYTNGAWDKLTGAVLAPGTISAEATSCSRIHGHSLPPLIWQRCHAELYLPGLSVISCCSIPCLQYRS